MIPVAFAVQTSGYLREFLNNTVSSATPAGSTDMID
jgi:hypothetical protein